MAQTTNSQESAQAVGTTVSQQVSVNVAVRNKNSNIFVTILLLLGLGAGWWFWTAANPGPEATVERFLTAFNDRDLDGMIACLDPKYEKLYGAVSSIFGEFMGISGKDLAAFFPFMVEMAVQDPNSKMEDLQIEAKVISTKVDGDRAVVTVSGVVRDRRTGKTKESGEGTVQLRKFGDAGWRIVE